MFNVTELVEKNKGELGLSNENYRGKSFLWLVVGLHCIGYFLPVSNRRVAERYRKVRKLRASDFERSTPSPTACYDGEARLRNWNFGATMRDIGEHEIITMCSGDRDRGSTAKPACRSGHCGTGIKWSVKVGTAYTEHLNIIVLVSATQ